MQFFLYNVQYMQWTAGLGQLS